MAPKRRASDNEENSEYCDRHFVIEDRLSELKRLLYVIAALGLINVTPVASEYLTKSISKLQGASQAATSLFIEVVRSVLV